MTFTSPVSEDDLQRQVILMLKKSIGYSTIKRTFAKPTAGNAHHELTRI